MPRKVFTAGEVLAAADVNEFLQDQAVMSFAGTAARGSAIGTAVEGMVSYLEDIDSLSVNNGTDWTIDRTIQVFAGTAARGSAIPSPVEGMYAHLNDTDTLQYYDGSAWADAGASSGVTLINTTSFTSESSVIVNNVFSSTYDFYKVYVQSVGSTGADFFTRLAASGTAATGANYSGQLIGAFSTSSNFVSLINQTSFLSGNSGTTRSLFTIELANPGTSVTTAIKANGGIQTIAASNFGVHSLSTAYDGINIFPGSGTITGTISIYGYRK